jgi:Na+/melibiose symporter-like transporter
MGLAVGAAMTVLGLIATLGTLDHGPGTARHAAAPAPPRRDFLAGSVRSLAIPSFRRVFTSVFLFFLAVGVNGSLLLHFLTFYAGITGSGALAVLQAGFHLAAIAGLLVWLRASRAVEKHRLYLLGCVGMAVLMLAAFLLLGEGRPLGTGNVAALLAIYALAGFFGSVVWFLPATMIADVVDQDHLATGRRREGSFFGIFSFGQQLAVGCSLLVSGVLLDAFAGLVPGQATQSPETRWRIGFACCVVPAALLLSAGVAMLRYELGRRHVRAIQARLSRRSTP